MKKKGVNRKERLIGQIDVPTKPLHSMLKKASLWLLTPQLFAPIFNLFSAKIAVLCIASLSLSIAGIIASKHPSNSYARNLHIKTNIMKRSETVEAFSTLAAITIIIIVIYLYGSDLISHIQI